MRGGGGIHCFLGKEEEKEKEEEEEEEEKKKRKEEEEEGGGEGRRQERKHDSSSSSSSSFSFSTFFLLLTFNRVLCMLPSTSTTVNGSHPVRRSRFPTCGSQGGSQGWVPS